MRVLINDFGGYPFPFELTKCLADRNFEMHHCYCASLVTTPQASMTGGSGDYQVWPTELRRPLDKYSFVRRRNQEQEYGQRVSELIQKLKPEVVLSANTPLDALKYIDSAIHALDVKGIVWLQDVLSIATKRILARKLKLAGRLIGSYYERMERRLLQRADRIVLISEAFRSVMDRWAIDPKKLLVVTNWAPIKDLPVLDRRNAWSQTRNLNDKKVFLYSGTLSMKHDPSTLSDLAAHVATQNAVVVVRSQGMGADWLRATKGEQGIDNLFIEPFGPYEATAQAFASADVLVALLEPEASEYSVPSKVLAYLCAGRPILLSMAKENAAAAMVLDANAGLVASPEDRPALLSHADVLLRDPTLAAQLGCNARKHAEKIFNIDLISERFVRLFAGLSAGTRE